MTSPEHEPERRFDQIRPAAIRLSAAEARPAPDVVARPRYPAIVWIALGALAAALVVVIFLLPGWIGGETSPPAAQASTPTAGPTPGATPQGGSSPTPAASGGGAAPYSQALQAQQRKDAQEVLERLLELQKSLKQLGVESWAAAEFAAAIRLAEEGDGLYGAQDFAGAGEKYTVAVQALEELERLSSDVHARALKEGLAAIAAGDSGKARAAFGTALLIRPDDADAAKGMQRAEKLDQVLALVAEGRTHLDNERLADAQASFQKAIDLDPETAAARAGLEETKLRIVDGEFRMAMSRGYAALESGDADSARRHFAEAVRLKPSATDAQGGLRDAQNRITSARIRALLGEAQELERSEQWQAAVGRYDEALKIDPNLLPGQQGREAAARRAALDERLRQAIARPERLSDRTVRAETAALLRDAGNVAGPGPELKKQIAVLTALLAQAEVPVRVSLQSDGETDVVIYKVGPLGRFTATETTLIPGRYVAAGTRSGYRDVRVEFEIAAGQVPPVVVVRCDEPIKTGR
jgi:tetratricopeptide (TPR) repeat protein